MADFGEFLDDTVSVMFLREALEKLAELLAVNPKYPGACLEKAHICVSLAAMLHESLEQDDEDDEDEDAEAEQQSAESLKEEKELVAKAVASVEKV